MSRTGRMWGTRGAIVRQYDRVMTTVRSGVETAGGGRGISGISGVGGIRGARATRVLRVLVQLLAWSLATCAAAALSWWGVHTVMTGTAYDPHRALPVVAASSSAPAAPKPTPARPSPSTPTAPTAPTAEAAQAVPSPRSKSPAPHTTSTGSPSPSPSSSRVRAYDTDGGRVVFDLGETSATLVSATPAADWSMQVWKTGTWIRVEFASDTDHVSVFCTWHDTAPRVQIENY
ncbi:hypothetical protein OK074_0673 [Actinobacteria bacterium OK074]|nr:hypothetical protein OK074_0673 [Actinobacteria bacterium OK074]